MKMPRSLPALLLGLLVAAPTLARPDSIRSWTDANGVVHYSNVGSKGRSPAKLKKAAAAKPKKAAAKAPKSGRAKK